MVTPNKQAILEKAKELWVKDQIRNGCSELAELNPEYKELLESGYIYAAQQELMRSTDGYAEYIEREYAEVNNKTKVEFAKLKMQSFAVDVAECLRDFTDG
jgi:hypothetical protein